MADEILRILREEDERVGSTSRYWNPKMASYIFGARSNLHIINLEKTLPLFNDAMRYLEQVAANQGKILFVGTKKATRKVIEEEAKRAGMPYINYRWLGGMLTNFKTIKQLVARMKELEAIRDNGLLDRFSKKEGLGIVREMDKLVLNLGGIRDMHKLPDVLFIIDVGYEKNAVSEAQKLGIPVVGIVDTNHSPVGIDYVIPGDKNSVRAVQLYAQTAATAILHGKANGLSFSAGAEEFTELDSINDITQIELQEINHQKITSSQESKPQVSAGIEEDEWPLVIGKNYQFYVSIGVKRDGALGGGLFPEPNWGNRSELDLVIAMQGDGLRFNPPTKHITLRKTMETLIEHFTLEPLRPGQRSAWIMIQLSRELTLLQEYRVTLEVVEAPEEVKP